MVGTSTTPIHTFDYDTDRPGYLYRVTDDAGTHTYFRNQAGEVLTVTDVLSGVPLTTTNRYDAHGRLDRITYPSGLQVDYQFDIYGEVHCAECMVKEVIGEHGEELIKDVAVGHASERAAQTAEAVVESVDPGKGAVAGKAVREVFKEVGKANTIWTAIEVTFCTLEKQFE